jgi:hypothetical protein
MSETSGGSLQGEPKSLPAACRDSLTESLIKPSDLVVVHVVEEM